MKKIEALEPSKHIQGRFLIRFEGERELLKVTENEVASFSLYSGRELEEDELAALQKAGSLSSAKARGARMLGERPPVPERAGSTPDGKRGDPGECRGCRRLAGGYWRIG